MATLTIPQTYAVLQQAGFSAAAALQMTAVAIAESGLRTDAVGDVGLQDGTWGPSVGLFQARTLNAEQGSGSSRDRQALTTPLAQAKSAYEISNGGRNLKPWSTWNHGTAQAQLSKVYAALGTTPGQAPPGAVDAPLPADSSSPPAGTGGATADVAGFGLPDVIPDPGEWVDKLSANLSKTTILGVAITAGMALVVLGFVRLTAPAIAKAAGGVL